MGDQKLDETNSQEWSKMTEAALNAGYKEGVISGRESVYHEGFRRGFEIGFGTGFTLAMYNTISKLDTSIHIPSEQNNTLTNVKFGNCQICVNEKYLYDPIKDVDKMQIKECEDLLFKHKPVFEAKIKELSNYE